jgi:hypothetical protein
LPIISEWLYGLTHISPLHDKGKDCSNQMLTIALAQRKIVLLDGFIQSLRGIKKRRSSHAKRRVDFVAGHRGSGFDDDQGVEH